MDFPLVPTYLYGHIGLCCSIALDNGVCIIRHACLWASIKDGSLEEPAANVTSAKKMLFLLYRPLDQVK